MTTFLRYKLVLFAFCLVSIVSASESAHAIACPADVRTSVLQALHNMSLDARFSRDDQEKAAFTIGVIRRQMHLECNLKTLQNSIRQTDLETDTFKVSVYLFNGTIVSLKLDRKHRN